MDFLHDIWFKSYFMAVVGGSEGLLELLSRFSVLGMKVLGSLTNFYQSTRTNSTILHLVHS